MKLRQILLYDGLMCLVTGLLLFFFPGDVLNLIWQPAPETHPITSNSIREFGGGVFLIGAYVGWVARMKTWQKRFIYPILAVEVLWIDFFLFFLVYYFGSLSVLGILAIVLSIVAVSFFLIVEYKAFRHEYLPIGVENSIS